MKNCTATKLPPGCKLRGEDLGKVVASVRPRYLPLPYQESLESGRLILRDGTSAAIRLAQPDDCEAMKNFFAALSSESQRRRFFGFGRPAEKLVKAFCDPSTPRKQLSLIVSRSGQNGPRIIATGNYIALDDNTAEVAMAVDDAFHGKGIGTLLLERLTLLAVKNGFRRFRALTLSENKPMLEVFQQSGFECQRKYTDGYVEIDLSVNPNEVSVTGAELRDRASTVASLRAFFRPGSVAVIGASRNPASIGGRILSGLIAAGFHGAIYPVNPSAAAIGGLAAYATVTDIPQPVDLAIIAVPRDAVLHAIDDCAGRGVRAVVVITAGFAETGADGAALQRQLIDKIRGYGMRMVGPNCLGLMNADPAVRLNASFSPLFPAPGRTSFSSQSGALGLAILSLAQERQLGLANFISVGNKADVSGNDLLQYWEEDGQTELILLYLESFGNPRRFARIAKRVGRRKPIVAVKAGRTGAGHRAAGSHTAALAASDVAVESLFHQTGVIRAETLEELFDLATALSSQPLPGGRRVGILTNAGGLGILCADSCEANGLNVPELRDETRDRLKAFLPAAASVTNPVDMIASATAEQFRKAMEILLSSSEVDALIVLYIDVGLAGAASIAQGIAAGVGASRKTAGAQKPVLACVMASETTGKPIKADGEDIPNFGFPESPARVLGKLAGYCEWRNRPAGMIPEFPDITPEVARSICATVLQERGAGWLSAEETRRMLAALALPLPRGGVCRTEEETAAVAREIGFPVALKLASREIIHKTEFGGVQLNLQDEAAVRRAFEDIRRQLAQQKLLHAMDGVIVQPMISGGVELMVGVTQDPSFGPLIAFGLGGIHVEILKDVSFRVTPITDLDAAEMVRNIRGYRLLQGYRGHPPADIPSVEELLLRVARLVEEVPEIDELDLNPVIALPPGRGCLVVDARIRVKPEKNS
jgi:acetyl coenzyme A synthetase (ADP forming)-like protein